MFEVISVLFPLVFVIILGLILFQIFSGVRQWHHNNQQPVLTVDAVVVSKRFQVHRSTHHHDGHVHHHSNTTYYGTFEVESGDRMEFRVSGKEYGMLAEGDRGKLTFQGTRYHQFIRDKMES